MKIYKRSFFTILKSFLINLLASFVFFLLSANIFDLTFGLVSTFFIYTILMYFTFIKDNIYFEIKDDKFLKFRGKKILLEVDIKNKKITKDLTKGVIGYDNMNIIIGNEIINCSILNLDDYQKMYQDLIEQSKKYK